MSHIKTIYIVSVTTIKNYHKFSSLNNINSLSYTSIGQKSSRFGWFLYSGSRGYNQGVIGARSFLEVLGKNPFSFRVRPLAEFDSMGLCYRGPHVPAGCWLRLVPSSQRRLPSLAQNPLPRFQSCKRGSALVTLQVFLPHLSTDILFLLLHLLDFNQRNFWLFFILM